MGTNCIPWFRSLITSSSSKCKAVNSKTPATPVLTPYKYSPLNTNKSEIRLIHLAPGKPEDPIAFSITHAALIIPEEHPKDSRPPIEELQKTLPDSWSVKETLNGRYLFVAMGYGTPNSWNHPVPCFDRSLYELPNAPTQELYQPEYEALSYTWGSNENPVMALVETIGDHGIATQKQTMLIGQNLACALRHLRVQERFRTLWVDAVCINQQDINEKNSQVPRMTEVYSLAKTVIIWLGPEGDKSTQALSTIKYFAQQIEVTTDSTIGDSPGAEEKRWWHMDSSLPYDDSTWTAISSLFHRKWFTRIWVLQEAMLSSNAVVQCDLIGFFTWYSRALKHPTHHTLQGLLLWTVNQESTDPRDKIYGILSLMSPKLRREITVDYNMSVVDVFKDAVLAHMRFSKRVDLLRDCQPKTRMKHCPSWVPSWAPGTSYYPNLQGYRRHVSGYSAAQVEYHAPNELHVLGVSSGVVATATRLSGRIHDICKVIHHCEPHGLFSQDYVGGGKLLDAFIEVIAKGQIQDRFTFPTGFPLLLDLCHGYNDVKYGTTSLITVLESYKKVLESEDSWIFVTEDGYLGATPSEAKPGDVVSVLVKVYKICYS